MAEHVSGTAIPLSADASSLTTASSFWKDTPQNKKILDYWIDIQAANGAFNKAAPPATFQQFVQAMQNVQLTASSAAVGFFIPISSLSTVPGVVVSPAAPPAPSTSSQIFSGLLGSFIANYIRKLFS